jgi:hypothetical protein
MLPLLRSSTGHVTLPAASQKQAVAGNMQQSAAYKQNQLAACLEHVLSQACILAAYVSNVIAMLSCAISGIQ